MKESFPMVTILDPVRSPVKENFRRLPGALPPDQWRAYRTHLKAVGKQRIKRCPYCQRWMARAAETLDHIHPRAKGGTNDDWNLIVVCSECNHRKVDQTPLQLFRW